MIFVAVFSLVVAVVAVVTAAGVVRSLVRQQARERELLLNQIMHLSGHTWTPPPADEWKPPAVPDDYSRYVLSSSDVLDQ